MSEYIIEVDEKDERWHYFERQYTHFFGYPLTGEIVRCRDCKHYIDGECMKPDGNGDYLRLTVPPAHFCGFGERRA